MIKLVVENDNFTSSHAEFTKRLDKEKTDSEQTKGLLFAVKWNTFFWTIIRLVFKNRASFSWPRNAGHWTSSLLLKAYMKRVHCHSVGEAWPFRLDDSSKGGLMKKNLCRPLSERLFHRFRVDVIGLPRKRACTIASTRVHYSQRGTYFFCRINRLHFTCILSTEKWKSFFRYERECDYNFNQRPLIHSNCPWHWSSVQKNDTRYYMQ